MSTAAAPLFTGRVVELVPMGLADPEIVRWLAAELDRTLGTRSRVAHAVPLYDDWRDAERGQFTSNALIDFLAERPAAAEDWSLGITEADLFAEDRTFVFGEATLGGCCAVISLARIQPLPDAGEGPEDLRRRAYREAVHELGHVGGLNHCEEYVCVMAPAAGVADVDRAGAAFCGTCHLRLAPPAGG